MGQDPQTHQSVVMLQTDSQVPTVTDIYRLPTLAMMALLFCVLVLLLSKLRGLGSLLGLVISLAIVIWLLIPWILSGGSPLLASIICSLLVMLTTMYLAHGINRQTSIAILSTFIVLTLTGILASLFVAGTQLTGLGSEEAAFLTFSNSNINLRGLLLGAILIGTLGVLDDVTTSQTATVFELARANPKLNRSQLFTHALAVGREHVSSLTNTLFLAYTGASLPLLILLTTSNIQPLWVTLNSQLFAEEIVRTLSGSIGLVLAIPISTYIATRFAARR